MKDLESEEKIAIDIAKLERNLSKSNTSNSKEKKKKFMTEP